MADDHDERVRRRAHEIWEREGKPHGRHDDHWRQAMDEVLQEGKGRKASDGAKPRGRKAADGAADASAPTAAAKPGRGRKAADGAAPPKPARAPKATGDGAAAPRRSRKAATASDDASAAGSGDAASS